MNAIIIIDMWAKYPHNIRRFDTIHERLGMDIADKIYFTDIPIVVSTYPTQDINGKDIPLNEDIRLATMDRPNTLFSIDYDEVINFLMNFNVTTIYYMGVSVGGCIQDRSVGVNAMKTSFSYKIVADCVANYFSNKVDDIGIIHSSYHYLINNHLDHIVVDIPGTNNDQYI